MYISIYEPTQTTLLTMTSGKTSDVEWQTLYDEVIRMGEDATRAKQSAILVSISSADAERPNASWRRKFAELRMKNVQPQAFSVIVTPSLLYRSVLTAINWIAPTNAKQKIIAVDTFEEGLVWLRDETKKPIEYLRDMHHACLAKLPKSSIV